MAAASVLRALRGAAIAVILAGAQPLAGQQSGRTGSTSRPATAMVRAEFASVLLQSRRYDEAAREYRMLLERNPDRFEYRLGLARALAWGEHHREAEVELVRLATSRGAGAANAEITTLLRSARASFDPRAVEAAGWVTSDPFYAPYRLSLARALAREGMPRLAIAHYDTLLVRGGLAGTDRSTLVREMAEAFVSARDLTGGETALRGALAFSPGDTSLRHTLATLLVGARRLPAAHAQYDSLIATAPTAALLVERARVRLALGDRREAESDLTTSLNLTPTAEAYLLLGTLYRERADYGAAHAMYDAARGHPEPALKWALAEARAQLAREERPVAAFAPVLGADPGWQLTEEAAADNLGVMYSALALTRAFNIAANTSLSAGVEYRQLVERANGRTVAASGQGGFLGLSRELALGWLLARAEVAGGALYHPLAGTIPEGRAGIGAWFGAWQVSAEASTAAAYPSLFTTSSLLPPGGGDPLVERGAGFTLGGPMGRLDAAGRWHRSRLSDGNSRTEAQGLLRYRLVPSLYLVYSAGLLEFAERSTLYWDPAHYVTHGAGIEYAVRRTRGLSFSGRVLPALASSMEALPLPGAPALGADALRGPLARHTAAEVSGSGEMWYRAPRWEAAAAASYGRGRAGDYQRFGASISVRILP